MTPQERPVAWHPKFGERVEGIYASPENPQRVGMFVRSGRVPHGRMNAGPWWELTDGKGMFWRYPPECCRPAEPRERPVCLVCDGTGEVFRYLGEGDTESVPCGACEPQKRPVQVGWRMPEGGLHDYGHGPSDAPFSLRDYWHVDHELCEPVYVLRTDDGGAQ